MPAHTKGATKDTQLLAIISAYPSRCFYCCPLLQETFMPALVPAPANTIASLNPCQNLACTPTLLALEPQPLCRGHQACSLYPSLPPRVTRHRAPCGLWQPNPWHQHTAIIPLNPDSICWGRRAGKYGICFKGLHPWENISDAELSFLVLWHFLPQKTKQTQECTKSVLLPLIWYTAQGEPMHPKHPFLFLPPRAVPRDSVGSQ